MTVPPSTMPGGPSGDLDSIIDGLDLPERDKHLLRSRWLDQVQYMDSKADRARDRYYGMRLTTVIGGVVVPGLVSLNLGAACEQTWLRWVTFGVSLLVAITAAVEEFFHYGERWRHFRQTAETLKLEGWQFFLHTGPYRRFKTHTAAYPAFTGQVEAILQQDVTQYFGRVVTEQREDRPPDVVT